MRTAAKKREKPLILMIEDNPGDAELMRVAIEELGSPCDLEVAGAEAADSLLSPDGRPPCPDLIFLDLSLPGIDARDLLRRIKEDARCRRIPVLVFSGSTLPADVRESYALHANAFLMKPSGPRELLELMRCTLDFWLVSATLAAS